MLVRNSEEPDEGADETLCLDKFRATYGTSTPAPLGKHSTDLDPLLPACEPCAPKQVKVADGQGKVDDPFGGGSLSPSSEWFDPREGAPPQVWPQASNTPTYLGSPCTDEGDSTPAVVAGSDISLGKGQVVEDSSDSEESTNSGTLKIGKTGRGWGGQPKSETLKL